MVESHYDGVFSQRSQQAEVYGFVSGKRGTGDGVEAIERVMQGFNCTVFAYGQTGSGKTFTMFGPHWDEGGYEPFLGSNPA